MEIEWKWKLIRRRSDSTSDFGLDQEEKLAGELAVTRVSSFISKGRRNRMHGRVRTGIQFAPSSQLQSQIVPRGIQTVRLSTSLWKYRRANLLPFSSFFCLLHHQSGIVQFVKRQATLSDSNQRERNKKQLAEFPWISLSIATT